VSLFRAVKPMNEFTVDHTRAWTGLWVVIGGDVAIALAAILAVLKISSGSTNVQSTVSILSSAFTAIGTMTTAYFGIRAVSNTAQHSIAAHPANPTDGTHQGGDGSQPQGGDGSQPQGGNSPQPQGGTGGTSASTSTGGT
jgi:hypothetical protein